MVIFNSKEGQLANRLWQAANFLANAIEYDYKFLHLGFGDYIVYFTENGSLIKEYGKCRIIDFNSISISEKLILKYTRVAQKMQLKFKIEAPFFSHIKFQSYAGRFDLSKNAFVKLSKNKFVLVEGWFFEDTNAFIKHSNIIREVFKPAKVYLDNVKKLKNENFSKFDKIIGVHIRKGDYQTYNDGKWYYSNSEYASFVKQISLLQNFRNKNIAFLLCSDEDIDLTDFENFNIISSTKHLVEDLYSLSFCDFIIGPPSTFSSWASFYGNVPLLRITDRDFKIAEEDFKMVEHC